MFARENVVWHDVTAAKMEHHHITIQIVARDGLSLPNTSTLKIRMVASIPDERYKVYAIPTKMSGCLVTLLIMGDHW